MIPFSRKKFFAILFSLGILFLRPLTAASDSRENAFFIPNAEIRQDICGNAVIFPKYTGQLMNIANQNAQATRPKNVGQLSEMIQEFPGRDYEEWIQWYQQQQPGAIDRASEKVYEMIIKLRKAMAQIDEEMVRKWVADLVLAKSYAGLRFQQSILKQIAAQKKLSWRLAEPEEESKGIDGYIGNMPVSVKPVTYQAKAMLPEEIEVKIIRYEKKKSGIRVYYDF